MEEFQRKKKAEYKLNGSWRLHRGDRTSQSANYRSLYPEKYEAHKALNSAVRAKRIIRPCKCDDCGNENKFIQAHHEDYLKPLDVIWLCYKCHNLKHRKEENYEGKG